MASPRYTAADRFVYDVCWHSHDRHHDDWSTYWPRQPQAVLCGHQKRSHLYRRGSIVDLDGLLYTGAKVRRQEFVKLHHPLLTGPACRISTTSGHPPPSIQHDDTQCRASLDSPFWTDLISTFDLYRFLNRFHSAMSVHASIHGQAPSSEVARWEQEFETLKPAMIQSHTGKTLVTALQ